VAAPHARELRAWHRQPANAAHEPARARALYWAGDIVCLWAALQLVGGHKITVAALVLAYTGGYILTRRALPAGGAGFVEVALTFALVAMGARFIPALIGVLVYRLFNFWLPILPALALMPLDPPTA
jgi:uncharacterized membrane protein YbhN (UPF0104 family)